MFLIYFNISFGQALLNSDIIMVSSVKFLGSGVKWGTIILQQP